MREKGNISYVQRWLLAVRPRTLPAAVAPVLVGAGVAFHAAPVRWLPVLAALFAAVMIQIGTNLVNDVVDYLRGTDDAQRLGPLRVTQAGLLTPKQVWAGVGVSFGLAALAGLYLSIVGGLPILLLGIVCILAGFAYSAGPFPLSHNGLGDLFTMLCFGFGGVCGTAYLAAGFLPASAWASGLGVGALVTAILIVNNIRDVESDRRAGRHNIPIWFGRRGGEIEFAVMLGMAFLVPVILVGANHTTPWVFTGWLALPAALRLFRNLCATEIGPAFNQLLAATAQLTLHYSVLLTFGFVVGTLFGG